MPTYAYFAFVVVAISWIVRNKARLLSIQRAIGGILGDPLRFKGDTALSSEQRWAIAAGADLAVRNGQFLDALPTGLTHAHEILSTWWGIESREDALDMLRHLAREGHRASYQQVVTLVRGQPESQQRALIERVAFDIEQPELAETFETLLASQRLLVDDGLLAADAAPPNLLAWDLGRLINICRWCFDVGWLSEEECWRHILPAADALQREYDSWSELSTAYVMGFVMWKGGDPDLEYGVLKSDRKLLLSDARSPWKRLAFSPVLLGGELARA
ncbi:MAG: hypothetical protein RLZZ450_6088 [Pseudomonadota bacterium]|jgi:hypothetical protein